MEDHQALYITLDRGKAKDRFDCLLHISFLIVVTQSMPSSREALGPVTCHTAPPI